MNTLQKWPHSHVAESRGYFGLWRESGRRLECEATSGIIHHATWGEEGRRGGRQEGGRGSVIRKIHSHMGVGHSLQGGKWILEGAKETPPSLLVPLAPPFSTLTLFKFMSCNFTLQEIPPFSCFTLARMHRPRVGGSDDERGGSHRP